MYRLATTATCKVVSPSTLIGPFEFEHTLTTPPSTRGKSSVTSLYRSPQSNLDYSVNLINSSINEFLHNIDNSSAPDEASDGTSNIVVPLPFKDQKSANSIKRKMQNLSAKIGVQIKPVFQSKMISQVLSLKEKLPIKNNQCVIYKFQCDLCDAACVGYRTRHLHQRIGEHKHSAIGRHLEDHGLSKSDLEDKQFSVSRKRKSV